MLQRHFRRRRTVFPGILLSLLRSTICLTGASRRILPLLDYSRTNPSQGRLQHWAKFNTNAAQLIVRAEEFLEFAQQQLDSFHQPDRCSNGQFFTTKETGKWEFLQRLTNTQRVGVFCLLKSAQLFPNAKPAENSVKHWFSNLLTGDFSQCLHWGQLSRNRGAAAGQLSLVPVLGKF